MLEYCYCCSWWLHFIEQDLYRSENCCWQDSGICIVTWIVSQRINGIRALYIHTSQWEGEGGLFIFHLCFINLLLTLLWFVLLWNLYVRKSVHLHPSVRLRELENCQSKDPWIWHHYTKGVGELSSKFIAMCCWYYISQFVCTDHWLFKRVWDANKKMIDLKKTEIEIGIPLLGIIALCGSIRMWLLW